jgi:hypothetical protein
VIALVQDVSVCIMIKMRFRILIISACLLRSPSGSGA